MRHWSERPMDDPPGLRPPPGYFQPDKKALRGGSAHAPGAVVAVAVGVGALKPVGAEEVALRLDQGGGAATRAHGVVIGKRR